MKKYILAITMMTAALSQAQVIISEQANPTPTNSSVLLEFGTQPKGIILPSVESAPGAVGGTFIVNTTDKAVQYYNGTAWVNLTYPETLVENTFVNDGTTDEGDGAVIGAESSLKPGVLVLESTTQAMVLPRVADPHLNILSPVAGTMVYDTTSDAMAVYDGAEWSYWAAALDPSGILNGVTLVQNRRYWIASVFDTDYIPYTVPTGAASIAVVNANGTPDAFTANHQGSLTTTGIAVRIPVASVTGSGNIGAWTNTFVVPAAYAEDGQSRTLELSWAAQPYDSSTKYINATIKSLGGDFLAKKLDINAGLGSDYLGFLLGTFKYPYNNAGTLTNYELRDTPGIPDRMIGVADNAGNINSHLMLYLPVQGEDGKIWLNNNLGAHYSNITHTSFNPGKQAATDTDHLAYGSLFQWGRKGDGHELLTRTGPGNAQTTPVHGTIAGPLTEPLSTPNFIQKPTTPFDWKTPVYDATRWVGASAPNNPCPHKFRVPNQADQNALIAAVSAVPVPANTVERSALRLTRAGVRGSNIGTNASMGTTGFYFTSYTGPTGDQGYAWTVTATGAFGSVLSNLVNAASVRCIQD